jgi:hypothetical protein
MADHFPAEISVGGNIPRRLLDELGDMIASEGVSIDWQHPADKAAVRAAIEAAAAQSQTVRFTDDEARGGQFEDLENWLTSHGIDFDRHNDARYEYDGENVYGRGRNRLVILSADQSGNDQVSAEEVRKVLADKTPAGQKLARITKLVAAPSPLTPIVLVDGPRKSRA